MEFSRKEYWCGLSFPSPGDLPDPRMEPGSPILQAGSLLSEPPGKPLKGNETPRSSKAFWQSWLEGVSVPHRSCRVVVLSAALTLLCSRRDALFLFRIWSGEARVPSRRMCPCMECEGVGVKGSGQHWAHPAKPTLLTGAPPESFLTPQCWNHQVKSHSALHV